MFSEASETVRLQTMLWTRAAATILLGLGLCGCMQDPIAKVGDGGASVASGGSNAGQGGSEASDAGQRGGGASDELIGPVADGAILRLLDGYQYVIVHDVSAAENHHGRPGADICGVFFRCDDGRTGNAVEATLTWGSGEFCHRGLPLANGESCCCDRWDASSAVGPTEEMCDTTPNDDGTSKSVSLGQGGTLTLRVDTAGGDLLPRGLAGCSLTVSEAEQGNEIEIYLVDVCADAEGTDCHPCLGAIRGEGTLTFDIPASCD